MKIPDYSKERIQPLFGILLSMARGYLSVSFDHSGGTIAYGSIGGSVGILDAATGVLNRELTMLD